MSTPKPVQTGTFPKQVPCNEHGASDTCYIMPDGHHVDAQRCNCFWSGKPDCPVHDRENHPADPPRQA